MNAARETSPQQILTKGCEALGLELSPGQLGGLLRYVEELQKWRRVYNLIGTSDSAQLVTAHLLDSLAVCPLLAGDNLLDIGSGAGLPGVPIAVARPDLQVVLLDANAKRTRFLTHVTGLLGLGNVEVVRERAENYNPTRKFDQVIARALADWPVFAELAEPLMEATGQALAMKSQIVTQAEHAAARLRIDEVVPLNVPGLSAQRCVVRGVKPAP